MSSENSFDLKKKELLFHFNEIYKKCGNSFQTGWGSYLFNGHNYQYDSRMYEKQKLLFDLSKKCDSILEVGVYMGHSLLIMLLANPKIKITCIDIEDKYSLPAVNYLKENFKDAEIKFIKGDSTKLLKNFKEEFDLYHIDGAHSPYVIAKEILLCLLNKKTQKIKFLFDDIDFMLDIRKSILSNFIVLNELITNCKGRNCYLEFKFNDTEIKKFENFYYKFLILSLPKRFISLVSLLFFPKRILNYIVKKFN